MNHMMTEVAHPPDWRRHPSLHRLSAGSFGSSFRARLGVVVVIGVVGFTGKFFRTVALFTSAESVEGTASGASCLERCPQAILQTEISHQMLPSKLRIVVPY